MRSAGLEGDLIADSPFPVIARYKTRKYVRYSQNKRSESCRIFCRQISCKVLCDMMLHFRPEPLEGLLIGCSA
jgi:hypothetical protein